MTDPYADEPWDSFDAALELHHEGRSQEALALLAKLNPDDVRRHALESEILTSLGELVPAEQALRRAEDVGGADDPTVLWARGALSLETWRLTEARLAFELLLRLDGGPDVLERLALIADLMGRPAEADRYLAEARALGSESAPARMTPRQFEEVVNDATQLLPEEFRAILEEVAVVIEPVPRPPLPYGPELLGLFVGRSLLNADSLAAGELPPTIRLYQRNLERVCRNRGELMEQIRITLYHELGHALGFDEHGVHAMGLG